MHSIKLTKRVGEDGILHLEIPVGITDKEIEIMVIYQAIEIPKLQKTPEELGCPPGFFEQTYGSCQNDPIIIDSEGDFEQREEWAFGYVETRYPCVSTMILGSLIF